MVATSLRLHTSQTSAVTLGRRFGSGLHLNVHFYTQESLFTTAKLDDFVPVDHPLRAIRSLTDRALRRMSGLFSTLYADTGRH